MPSLLLSCEIAIVAPFFLIAFSAKRYVIRSAEEEARFPRGYQGGPLGIHAILSAFNIIDIISTLVQGIKARGGDAGYSQGMQNSVHGYADSGEESTQRRKTFAEILSKPSEKSAGVLRRGRWDSNEVSRSSNLGSLQAEAI